MFLLMAVVVIVRRLSVLNSLPGIEVGPLAVLLLLLDLLFVLQEVNKMDSNKKV